VQDAVTDIRKARRVLNYEIHRYNDKQVHPTQEVPYFRVSKITGREAVPVSGVSGETTVSIGEGHLLPASGENC
jgi:hypothetical protein